MESGILNNPTSFSGLRFQAIYLKALDLCSALIEIIDAGNITSNNDKERF
jgi:hypothetical protein